MNVFDIDNQPTVRSSYVRRALGDRYNRTVHTQLWRSLREAVGIPLHTNRISKQQGWLLLCAGMAYFEQNEIPTGVALIRCANEKLSHWKNNAQSFLDSLGEPIYTKEEMLDIIQRETGRRPADSTLRRWRSQVPKSRRWQNRGTYTQGQVERILAIARKSSARRVA